MAEASDVKNLVAAFLDLGLSDDSADFIGRTLNEHVTNPEAWLELAASLRRQRQYEAAMRTYEFAERRFPMLPQLPNNRGLLLREAGQLEAALAAFTQAVGLKPDYGNALESRGNALELLGRFAEAEGVYRTLLEWEPKRATAWNNLGNCAQQLGRRAEARRCYDRAVQLDPDYVFALVNLAGLLDEEGDRDSARTLVERALALDPEDKVAVHLIHRFESRAPARALLPPAWDQPLTLGWLNAAGSLKCFVEKRSADGRIMRELIKRSQQLTDRTGFMAWHTTRLQADPVGDPGPEVVRLPPPTPTAPRLFVAYSWAQDDATRLDGAYVEDIITYASAAILNSQPVK